LANKELRKKIYIEDERFKFKKLIKNSKLGNINSNNKNGPKSGTRV